MAARAAEDAGDFPGALRLVQQLPASSSAERWSRQLEQVVALPEDSPLRPAWLVHPAVRWAHERPAGELLERHARLLLTTLGVPAPDREQFVARVAATDPVVLDAGLFDGGLFSRYLAESCDPALLVRSGPLEEWPQHPPSVWRLARRQRDCALLYDQWSLESVRVHRWPAMNDMAPGTLVFGRLVPVLGSLGLAFALRPVRVDQRCAARLLRARRRGAEPEERIRAVARFRRRDRQSKAAAA